MFLIEKFYDPDARAREQAIAAEVTRMAEQQKVTDNLTLIEIDIENAIMNNDLDTARRELAQLVEKAPDHPRREFLEKSIDRAAELARLSPPGSDKAPDKGAEKRRPGAGSRAAPGERSRTARTRHGTPAGAYAPNAATPRTPDRTLTARTERAPPPPSRSFGAPISESPREAVIPLDAPINTPPTYTARRPTIPSPAAPSKPATPASDALPHPPHQPLSRRPSRRR